jgi:hypothetical protein
MHTFIYVGNYPRRTSTARGTAELRYDLIMYAETFILSSDEGNQHVAQSTKRKL